jgi:hypothetical protein
MKKVLILLLVSPLFLKAQQENLLDNIYIGIQAGLNFSDYLNPVKFQNDSIFESSRSTLPFIGANITVPFNDYLNFRIGGAYSMKGTNYLMPQYLKIRYNYFDFPTMVQIKTGNYFRFEAGVVPSILMSSKAYYHAASDSVVRIPKYGSGVDLAIHFGAEVTLQRGIDIGFCYEMPTRSSSFDNFKFSISYKFRREIFQSAPRPDINLAYDQIKDIRNNAVLVRLKTSENQIRALKETGHFEEAEQLKKRQRSINLEIMNAFKKNFNFCPVYFFYSSSTNQIKHNNFDGNLLNENLEADTLIKFRFNRFYVAEFDYIDPDTSFVDRSLYDQKAYKSDSSFAVSSSHLDEALILRNAYFTQLKEPLPAYVRMEEWLKRKNYAMAVAILNQQLYNFFKQSMLSDHP